MQTETVQIQENGWAGTAIFAKTGTGIKMIKIAATAGTVSTNIQLCDVPAVYNPDQYIPITSVILNNGASGVIGYVAPCKKILLSASAGSILPAGCAISATAVYF